MGRYEERTWHADPDAPGGRAERKAFRYRVYIPDEIRDQALVIPADVANSVSAAEREVATLNRDPPALGSLEVLARRLLRAESVASSRIEGLVPDHDPWLQRSETSCSIRPTASSVPMNGASAM